MKSYIIRLSWPEWVDYDHTIEAKNEEEAIRLAKMFLGNPERIESSEGIWIENMEPQIEFVDCAEDEIFKTEDTSMVETKKEK